MPRPPSTPGCALDSTLTSSPRSAPSWSGCAPMSPIQKRDRRGPESSNRKRGEACTLTCPEGGGRDRREPRDRCRGRAGVPCRGRAGRVAARDADALGRLAQELGAVTVTRSPSRPTSATRQSVAEMVRRAVERFGRLDYACNNAAGGGHPPTPLAEVAIDAFDSGIAVNLRGVFLSMREEIPAIVALRRRRDREHELDRRTAGRRRACERTSPPSTAWRGSPRSRRSTTPAGRAGQRARPGADPHRQPAGAPGPPA